MKETIKKINSILPAQERYKIAGLIVMMFFGGLLELAGVSGIFPVMQGILGMSEKARDYIIPLTLGLILLYVIKNAYLILMYRSLFRYTARGKSKLSVRLMNVYMHEPYEFHLKRNVAIIQRAVRGDAEGFYNVVRDLLQIVCEMIICFILAVLLFVTDPYIALFLMVLVGSCMGAVFAVSKKKISRLGKSEMECAGKLNQWLLQGIGGIKEIKLLGTEEYFVDNFKSESDVSAVNSAKQQLYMQLPRLLTETVCIGGVLIYIVIACKLGTELSSLLPTIAVFAVAAFRMLPSVGKINGLLNDYHFFRPRVDYVYEDIMGIQDANSDTTDNQIVESMTFEKNINIENLSFKYDGASVNVLENVNLKINKNESIGLVGPSGEGKTTLVDVIMGLLKPESGDITCDGKSINDNMRGWQSIIGYVPQSIYLADDSIRNNIAFGIRKQDIDEDRIRQVIIKAQLDEFITGLPDGLDTVVGDRGVRLSGGQRQRIGIARALYTNPKILVLDEATSALDNDTEAAVMDAIDALHGQMTMIIIAHRLSTIENCDRVYEVSDKAVKPR